MSKHKRKAISPVLATVILIAITLIAAVAIAGFVFGLFGSFTSSAQVSASIASCAAGTGVQAGNELCVLNFINTGTANTGGGTVCSVTWAGAQHSGVLSGAAVGAGNLPADSANHQATCTVTGATASSGTQIVGSAQLLNGGSAQFSGTAS